jgi:outer membrane receptor for ferrienterochelin and colicin
MFKKLFLPAFLTLQSLALLAQNGSIDGQIIDHKSQETIVGANVVIEGTTVGSSTDIDGNFEIANLKPGTYNIVVSFVTYKTQTVTDVVVEAGKRTTLKVSLLEDVAELAEVVVAAKKEISTDVNLVNEIKLAKLVVSGISADQILKMPDRDAAQVMQRVPGVTIADNRFVLIRGVPDRYNQVMINGIIAPSTEIDKRSFSFDLIPAGAIDQMLVYKSGGADLPGDFAGGVIQLVTKQPVVESWTKVGLNFGMRTGTTFGDFVSSEGSSTDIFGFDNGFRDLPENFPTTRVLQSSNRTSSVRERAGKSLTNNFDYATRRTPLDMGFNVATNNVFKIGNVRFSNLTTVNYSNSYQNFKSTFVRFNTFSQTDAQKRFQYEDSFYSNDVRISGLHNWLVEINPNHNIEFKNLFVQLGENESTIRRGDDFIQRPSDDLVNYAYHYMSRTILSSQLQGTHKFVDGTLKLQWVAGTNRVNRNEPDYRRFRTFRPKTSAGTEDPFSMQLPAAGNLFETGRFWSTLEDISYSHGLNVEKKFGEADDKRAMTLKAGYYGEIKTREFDARYLNYLYPGGDANGEILRQLPLSEIFSPVNIKKDQGFVIEEGTTNQDSYNGRNTLMAGYISSFIPAGKFDVSLGFRGEYNIQELNGLFNTGERMDVRNPVFAPLPFMNVALNLSERSLMRLAYSRTVNRPEFRELAPFLYYQFEYEAGLFGNSQLKTAFINNIDLRWEMYPNPGEMISLGGFYKQFKNPIETYSLITTETPQLYFDNAEQAKSYGAELEIRKSLANLALNRFVRNLSVNLNAALIWSSLDIGDDASAGNLAQNRPLQGQSPYIINAGLYYQDEKTGWSFNTAYNVFGKRIFSVGDVIFPTWWEMPRHSLDVQLAKSWLGGRYETKLNIQNLLNTAYRFYQDFNLDNKIANSEGVVQRFQNGTLFNVSLAWKISGK